MKKLLLIILLFLFMPIHADAVVFICGPDAGGGEAPASCSGTYGYTDNPGTTMITSNGGIAVTKVTFDCTGTTSTFHIYTREPASNARELIPVVYEDDGGEPGDLLYTGTAFFDNGNWNVGWVSTSESFEFSPGTYWIGSLHESTSCYFYHDNNGTGTCRYMENGGYWDSPPDPWPVDTDKAATGDGGWYVTF